MSCSPHPYSSIVSLLRCTQNLPIFFLTKLKFELRSSCLIASYCYPATRWVSQAIFTFSLLFRQDLTFLPGADIVPWSFYIMPLHNCDDRRVPPRLTWPRGNFANILPTPAWTTLEPWFPISTSQIAGITVVRHHTLLPIFYNSKNYIVTSSSVL
jgi:hypothetical protein